MTAGRGIKRSGGKTPFPIRISPESTMALRRRCYVFPHQQSVRRAVNDCLDTLDAEVAGRARYVQRSNPARVAMEDEGYYVSEIIAIPEGGTVGQPFHAFVT